MKKVFHLNTCDTCRKILAQFDLSDWELREIRKEPVTEEELAEMYEKTQSYETLFSKKSTQIKLRGLDVKSLTEKDFKELLLDHYTFLKRPVFITNDKIFVGNDKKNVEALREFLI
ncbi:arsenate reductase family protein [Chryseobacterium nepalense]|uniref:Arsenate reductase family protein n=1 Tax=Chryseobacterium nepalense TaxID=1854498 RepID=A0ABY4K6E4_9FLAO|nr:ArsC/Spx/MgsR family protein [Chryseobacterium nepalense]UPQ75926.1 arsenate reductase family protein [Chryseobacterium nepalense]